MVRIPTKWQTNKNKNVNVPTYSDATITYSSATQRYVSPTVGLNELGKPSTLWTKATKPSTGWSFNQKFSTNQYAYDSATFVYDSASQTFDGIVTGQSSISTKPPTAWTKVL